MAGISVKLFGYPSTLSTDAAYGDIPCLVEAPQISAARFRIGDPVSSDQSCSMLLTGNYRVREMLSQSRASGFSRITAPVHPQDTRIYMDSASPVDKVWIGDELMMVTQVGIDLNARSPYYGMTWFDVTRGVDGTPVMRFDLDPDTGKGALVVPVTADYALPQSPRGKWGEIRIHRDPGEPCLNKDDPNHVHAEECSRVVFTGQVARVIDAGDTIELEMQSGIQTLLDQAWPIIPALPVITQTVIEDFRAGVPTATKDLEDPMMASTSHGPGRNWETYVSGLYKDFGTDYEAFNELIISTGPVYWADTTTHELEVLPDKVSTALRLPYAHINTMADRHFNWSSVVVFGTDGQRIGVGTNEARAATSSQEYIVLGLEYRGTRADPDPLLRPREDTLPGGSLTIYPLGTHGYRIPFDPGGAAHGYAAGWWPTRDDAASDTPPYNIRTGRLTSGDEYRVPSILTTNNAFRGFTWWSQAADAPAPPINAREWWLGQIWTPWVPENANRPPRYIDGGMSGIAHLVVNLQEALSEVFSEQTTWVPGTNVYRLPYGLINRPGTFPVGHESIAVFPPEYWYQKTLKDSFFNDLWASSSICWAPGKGGKLRPLRLSKDPSPVITLTGDDLRARDATLNFSFNRSLSRATVSGLPKNFRVPDDGDNGVWMPGQEPIIVRNMEESGGRAVTLKDSPFLRNDGLERGLQAYPAETGVTRFLEKITTTWRNAVNRFSAPVPEITLRIDGDLDVYPGDYVNLALPNVISSAGVPLSEDWPVRQLALCLERGDDLSDATAECTFLMVGWFSEQTFD